jgi:hypothetical protein
MEKIEKDLRIFKHKLQMKRDSFWQRLFLQELDKSKQKRLNLMRQQ